MIGEFFGATHDFEYNIGDKLYEFAIMSYEDFDKLKTMYTQLIELILHEFTENIKECMVYTFHYYKSVIFAFLHLYINSY
jgi:hypothetical protein